jgi:phosphoribosyl-ATP pyrophosphohydrolase
MSHPIDRLFAAVIEARAHDPATSRTAKLMREGVLKMAKKVAEEAVEVGLDAVRGERRRVVEESADLLYNLAVLWAGLGITPAEVWAEMDRRERMLGLAEKLPKAVRARGLEELRNAPSSLDDRVPDDPAIAGPT